MIIMTDNHDRFHRSVGDGPNKSSKKLTEGRFLNTIPKS